MEKTLKLKAVCYEGEMPKEYEVTYHFGVWYKDGGCPYIWCEYEGHEAMGLTWNYGSLPKESWTAMPFCAFDYWLVLPLLSAGIVKITHETQWHCREWPNTHIVVEVADGYYTKKKDRV